MARTQVSTAQVLDGSIRRADLNTTTAASAVIAKAIQGTGISLSSTGVDAGTGDVTISAPASTVLDALSTTRGTILYRGASAWLALAPGTAGHVLQSGGAGADPSWVPMAVDLTTYHLVSAATTNATVVKGSPGKLYGWYISNNNASARKVAFHNAASTPTAGAAIFFTLLIPGSGGANVLTGDPINFPTGIAITTVTGLADNDATAVALNDLNINLFYV